MSRAPLVPAGTTLAAYRDGLVVGAWFRYSGFYARTAAVRIVQTDDGENWRKPVEWDTDTVPKATGYSRWMVFKIVDRGVVVEHPTGGHRHLIEWDQPISGFEFISKDTSA